jgi:hypothetical protein
MALRRIANVGDPKEAIVPWVPVPAIDVVYEILLITKLLPE